MYTSRSATPPKSAKPKKNFMTFINNVVRKVFKFFRMIIHLTWAIIDNGMQLIMFFFSYLVKILSNPTTPCVVAIIAFAATVAIAALQWYQIGVWLGRMLQFRSVYGITAGVAGVLLGTGINVYQLAPTLWKIRKDVARAYAELGVDTEFEADEETVKSKQQHWLSFDHGLLKKTRLISYGIETGLVLGFVFLNGLNFFAIIQAAVSLLLPEKMLELVASTVSVLGTVSEHIYQESEAENVKF
jgi:hypothetical protein